MSPYRPFRAVVMLGLLMATHAFVPRSSLSFTSTATLASRPSSLSVVDPQHALDLLIQGTSTLLSDADSAIDISVPPATPLAAPPEAGGISYSKVSYYTILGLYLMSFPGLWSTIKRSTKAKMKRKTFVTSGENGPPVVVKDMETGETTQRPGKSLREEAGEIMAYMKANNYEVVEAGETITFRGIVPRSLSQAFFLTFCTALGMLSLALVLQIQFQNLTLPVIGQPNWFYLALLSPYAGLYYWKAGDRVDDCTVKLSTNDEETENEIIVQGSDEELERMWRTLQWQEKGMVKVEGILG